MKTPQSLDLSPKEIVRKLDKYIIGQKKAKRAVAIALRNRNRRKKVKAALRDEILPKNIIMIGPTGVGKTEIARRLAHLDKAPFIKVEATKFTEVGYVGRDVESIIRDLLHVAIGREKNMMRQKVHDEAMKQTEERLIDLLLPPSKEDSPKQQDTSPPLQTSYERTRQKMMILLRKGVLDDKEVDIRVNSSPHSRGMIDFPGDMGIEQMDMLMQNVLRQLKSTSSKKKRVKVKDARKILMQEITEGLIDVDTAVTEAIMKTEESGIVFLDEIDKIATQDASKNIEVSRQGVQRDLLPLVEGSTVNTRYGVVRTNHILFIAAGAFHMASPSDMIPEFQGRFPIRVELESLSTADLEKILTEPKNALVKQYQALLETEEVTLRFDKQSIKAIADVADQANRLSVNIGARRLITIMEKLLEEVLYRSPDIPEKNGMH